MKVIVDKDLCIGCGACQAICPDVFQINDDGLSEVINEEFDNKHEDEVIEALESCPTEAIKKN